MTNTRLPELKTRKLRKKEASELALRLRRLLAAEQSALDNTPENFQDTDRFYETEMIIENLEAAVETVESVYDC